MLTSQKRKVTHIQPQQNESWSRGRRKRRRKLAVGGRRGNGGGAQKGNKYKEKQDGNE